MSEENLQSIYELELHEEIYIGTGKRAMRVPGGWIYTTIHSFNKNTDTISQSVSTTFVPYEAKKGKTAISKPKAPGGMGFGG